MSRPTTTDIAYGVAGYSTGPGYDIASGWGTIYAPTFVPALVRQIDRQHGPFRPSRVALDALNRLRSDISESAATVARGQTVTVTGRGFILGAAPRTGRRSWTASACTCRSRDSTG